MCWWCRLIDKPNANRFVNIFVLLLPQVRPAVVIHFYHGNVATANVLTLPNVAMASKTVRMEPMRLFWNAYHFNVRTRNFAAFTEVA